MKKIKMSFVSAATLPIPSEVWVGNDLIMNPGLLRTIRKISRENKTESKLFIFADFKLKKPAHLIKNQLLHMGLKVQVIPLRVQEKLKDFDNLAIFYKHLLEGGADRHSILLAFGGGVVGDIVGFLAATYMRGIRWMNIPTTLLAQVDSGVGGKTGVNHPQGKNLIGAFHQPRLVICDVRTLETLSMRDRVSGLGEMVKYGLIYDTAFFSSLERTWPNVIGFHCEWQMESLVTAIHRCLQFKARTVEKDERDHLGIREVLNFGHTLGHALEAMAGYGYFRHGEAIIYGMRGASWLSRKLGLLSHGDYAKVEGFLARLPIPPIPSTLKSDRLLSLLRCDKKKKGHDVGIRFVLLTGIGKTVSQCVETSEALAAFHFLRSSK